jgi:hypothetical protein
VGINVLVDVIVINRVVAIITKDNIPIGSFVSIFIISVSPKEDYKNSTYYKLIL